MEITCNVCIHHCRLGPGQRGLCGARKNVDGTIICENYGKLTSMALDPIEKKPLKRFHPGSRILSVGSFGCNLRCPFCQNHEISMAGKTSLTGNTKETQKNREHGRSRKTGKEVAQGKTGQPPKDMPETLYVPPERLASTALDWRERKGAGNIGIAYTYNEPLVGWEYVRDTARLVRKYGMYNVLVTNGTTTLEILEELLPYIDAMNIDLKGFRQEYYRKLGGDLETVKAFITRAAQECHVELTTLVVPGENDGLEEMEEEARWIAGLDPMIPLHVTRFFPQYLMMDREPTDVGLLWKMKEVAERYLRDVVIGNV